MTYHNCCECRIN